MFVCFGARPSSMQALCSELDVEQIPEFLGGQYKGGWTGYDVTPACLLAEDQEDRSKVDPCSVYTDSCAYCRHRACPRPPRLALLKRVRATCRLSNLACLLGASRSCGR